jgi:hypothetical protein
MQSEIDLAELEAIKDRVERSLPSDVLTDMRRANVSLTLGSSSRGGFRPVVVDAGFAEEVAERELVEEMVSYRKNVTGLDHTVFISPRGRVQHAARIKLAIDPPDTVDPHSKTASIAIHDGVVMAGDPKFDRGRLINGCIGVRHIQCGLCPADIEMSLTHMPVTCMCFRQSSIT